MAATSIDFPCPRCHVDEGERCRTLTDGTDRTTPHDARRRKAGERVERPEQTRKQVDAREAGARYFMVAGALANLRNVERCRPVAGFGEDDQRDLAAAVEALARIDLRRRERTHIRESNRRFAKEQAIRADHDDLNR